MFHFKLVNKASGISSKGTPWCRITLACDHSDGSRSISGFFVSSEVAAKTAKIPLDTTVYVSATLDEKLHFQINDIRAVDSVGK